MTAKERRELVARASPGKARQKEIRGRSDFCAANGSRNGTRASSDD